MQICDPKQTNSKSAGKSDLGKSWGSIWEGFGTLWAVLGPLFGHILNVCWAFQLISFKNMGPRWAPRGLLDGFWIHFGRFRTSFGHSRRPLGVFSGLQTWTFVSTGPTWAPSGLLDRFWQGLGKIWMCLGCCGALTIETFASRGHFLNTLGVPCCLTLCYRNPRVASLRLAERHNTRGFRPQTRVKLDCTSGLVLLSLLEWVFVCYTGFKLLTE